MEDKLRHEDVAAVAELLETPQWKTVEKLSENYIWAIRKQFDSCSNSDDMFFHQGEIAGIKLWLKKLEDVARKARREEKKDVQED